MKRPRTFDLVMGHPLVGGPVALSAAVGMYASYDTGSTGLGLLCVALLGGIGKAQQEARAYRQWMKAWNAANPDAAPRRRATLGQIALLTVGLGLAAAYALNPVALVAGLPMLGMLAAVLATSLAAWRFLRWAVGRVRRRPSTAKPFAVAVIAQRGAVPTLANAYLALPRHCAAMIRGPQ